MPADVHLGLPRLLNCFERFLVSTAVANTIPWPKAVWGGNVYLIYSYPPQPIVEESQSRSWSRGHRTVFSSWLAQPTFLDHSDHLPMGGTSHGCLVSHINQLSRKKSRRFAHRQSDGVNPSVKVNLFPNDSSLCWVVKNTDQHTRHKLYLWSDSKTNKWSWVLHS